MKTLNLFLKMHFTSLSPDGQCISLAIVTGSKKKYPIGIVSNGLKEARIYAENHGLNVRNPFECILISRPEHICSRIFSEIIILENTHISENMGVYIDIAQKTQIEPIIKSKSFYAEFTDFDINRCDDWVKENVISKLKFEYISEFKNATDYSSDIVNVKGEKTYIYIELKKWFSQFSDYKMNFIVDCGWFTWYKFVELMGEWEETFKHVDLSNECESYKWMQLNGCSKERHDCYDKTGGVRENTKKCGIPKLPANFPPVPQDLNELIAFKKGITVSEAFEVDREGDILKEWSINVCMTGHYLENGTDPIRFNALADAYVTKAIYEKLK